MNARYKPLPSLVDRFAYRGYLIQKGLTADRWYITKDGVNIACETSADMACRVIDKLVDVVTL